MASRGSTGDGWTGHGHQRVHPHEPQASTLEGKHGPQTPANALAVAWNTDIEMASRCREVPVGLFQLINCSPSQASSRCSESRQCVGESGESLHKLRAAAHHPVSPTTCSQSTAAFFHTCSHRWVPSSASLLCTCCSFLHLSHLSITYLFTGVTLDAAMCLTVCIFAQTTLHDNTRRNASLVWFTVSGSKAP